MQASRVLLVDPDVDALSRLATSLRERGVRVSLANSAQMACERAKAGGFDAVLATRSVAEPTDGSLGVLDALSVELVAVPPILILVDEGEFGEGRLHREDIDAIVQRIEQFSSKNKGPRQPSLTPSAHALENAPLGDLLVVLGAERRSGALSVTTPRGSGEIRLVDGDVADAVYVRLEGKKAVARLLGEREGTVTFTPGAPAIMRRVHQPARALVAETRMLASRAAELRDQAGDLLTSTLLAVEGAIPEGASPVDQHVLTRLRIPATLDELLDELPEPDASILEATLRLDALGRIKRLGSASARVQLCGADQLHLLRASAARARAPGFAGPARLVFAARPTRLAVFGHTVLSLSDAFPPQDPVPTIPVPYVLSTIRLGDGVELDLVALPLVPAYAPLWPLALAGASIVVRLDEGAAETLDEACATSGVPTLDSRSVFGPLDESSAVQVASIIKMALEAELGSVS